MIDKAILYIFLVVLVMTFVFVTMIAYVAGIDAAVTEIKRTLNKLEEDRAREKLKRDTEYGKLSEDVKKLNANVEFFIKGGWK